MGKRDKKKKLHTVLATIEGEKRERDLLRFLLHHYHDERVVKFTPSPIHGGNPDRLLNDTLKKMHCGYNRAFVWIDEDIDINEESRKSLISAWRVDDSKETEFLACPLGSLQKTYNTKMRNPILIVSQPVSVEALVLKILGKEIPPSCQDFSPKSRATQVKILKNCAKTVFFGTDELDYYNSTLTKNDLESRRLEIEELDLLIKMISAE